jgi:hypothetical protein
MLPCGWKVGTWSVVLSTSAGAAHVAGVIDRFDGPEKSALKLWQVLGLSRRDGQVLEVS